MLQLPIKDVIEKIKKETGLSEEEIRNQINSKLQSLEGLVSEEGAAYIVASELNVSLFKDAGSSTLKIKNVLAGMNNVEIVGKVLRLKQPTTFTKNNKKGEVASMVIGDETGNIRVVIWDKRTEWIKNGKIREGMIVKIKDAYAKENSFSGREIHLNNRSKLILEPEGVSIALAESQLSLKKISELNTEQKARILAAVVKIFRPRFYSACPICKRKVEETEEGAICPEHKIVTPKLEMVFNMILDDSTETIRAVAFSRVAERLAGMGAEEAQEILTKDGEIQLSERLNDFLLGKVIEVEGYMNENKAFDRIEFQITRSNLNPDPRILALNLMRGG